MKIQRRKKRFGKGTRALLGIALMGIGVVAWYGGTHTLSWVTVIVGGLLFFTAVW